MSVRPSSGRPGPTLVGSEGELLSIRITVEPRLLERLLDVLAHLQFPINPEISFAGGPMTCIDFPAWSSHLAEVREALDRAGFDPDCLIAVREMLEKIRAAKPAAARAIA